MGKDRIAAMASMVIQGETAADIGADHAELALYLLEAGITPKIIISELPAGPYNRACAAIQNSPYFNKIEARQGDGLQVLSQGEVYNIILAGMGGDTLAGIIAFDLRKAASFRHYVFQPMTKPQVLRSLLADLGWPILQEVLVKEKNKYFIIISAEPGGKPYTLSPLELDIGPEIIKKSSQPVVKGYLQAQLQKYRKIILQLKGAGDCKNLALSIQIGEKISELGAILHEED